MTWADLQPFATALAGIGALATFVLAAWRERHPLNTVQRLTAVAAAVQSPEARLLLESYRDERAVAWVLGKRAPTQPVMRAAGCCLQGVGVLALALWLLFSIGTPSDNWRWVFYVASLVLFLAGALVLSIREDRRKDWMNQERLWRGIAHPQDAERVRE